MSSPKMPGAPPPAEYLHNSFLDSGMIGSGFTTGRNQLRIDLGTPTPAARVGTPPARSPMPVAAGSPRLPGINQPGAVPGAPTLQQPGITVPSPGMVVPTIGGALAGSVPGATPRPTAPMSGPARR